MCPLGRNSEKLLPKVKKAANRNSEKLLRKMKMAVKHGTHILYGLYELPKLLKDRSVRQWKITKSNYSRTSVAWDHENWFQSKVVSASQASIFMN